MAPLATVAGDDGIGEFDAVLRPARLDREIEHLGDRLHGARSDRGMVDRQDDDPLWLERERLLKADANRRQHPGLPLGIIREVDFEAGGATLVCRGEVVVEHAGLDETGELLLYRPLH